MKIIEDRFNRKVEYPVQSLCWNSKCSSIYEFDKSDTYIKTETDGNFKIVSRFVDCPLCGQYKHVETHYYNKDVLNRHDIHIEPYYD